MSGLELAEGMDAYVALFQGARRAGGGPAAARLASDMAARAFAWPYPAGMQVFTTFVVRPGNEMAVRVYRPGEGTLPAICYLHGGGFSMGSLETFDGLAAALSEKTGAVVVAVQYRRLPDSSVLAAQEDAYAALAWIAEQAEVLGVDPARIAVAGDSAGALLATTAAMMARDRGGPAVCCQALLYGVYAMDPMRGSYQAAKDPVLKYEIIKGYMAVYCGADQAQPSPYPPPIEADDLAGLPPAVVVGAQYDPLLEEGVEYAGKLAAAGVPVKSILARGMIHGFLRAVSVSPAAVREMEALAGALEPYLWRGTKA